VCDNIFQLLTNVKNQSIDGKNSLKLWIQIQPLIFILSVYRMREIPEALDLRVLIWGENWSVHYIETPLTNIIYMSTLLSN